MDIKDQVRELAQTAGIRVLKDDEQVVAADRCWMDGSVHCPYGEPNGQFILRPEGFCNDRCPTFACNDPGTYILNEDELRQEVEDGMRKHFDSESVTVVSELEARADEVEKIQGEVLRLAAKIIKDGKLDRPILLDDDMPDTKAKRVKELAEAQAVKKAEAVQA